jgi:hypothetical protein
MHEPESSAITSSLVLAAAAGRAGPEQRWQPAGEWEPVFAAIEACHQAVHAMGCPRVHTTVKINTRTDKDQTLEDKVASVQALL